MPHAHEGTNYGDALRAFQRTYYRGLLTWFNGNVSKVSEYAGVDRTHLYELFGQIGLEPREFRNREKV